MKNKKYIGRFFCMTALAMAGMVAVSCEDEPDKYEIAGGTPTVRYIRTTDPASADSLITGAYMGKTICIVGENLRSITKMYFNDQEAILNTSYMTSNTLLVDVPNSLSDRPTDKIYMINKNSDTTTYDFSVIVPGPTVNAMSCEYAKVGSIASITGDYLLSYDTDPIQITFPGSVEVTNVISADKTSVTFEVPNGATEGYVTVTTKYGNGRSKFRYMDHTGVFLDMDAVTAAGSWCPGVYDNVDPEGIDGNYQSFNGTLTSWGTWSSTFFFHYWGHEDISDLDPANAVLKFEVNCPKEWLGIPLMMMFEPEVSAERNPYIDDVADFAPAQCHWKPYETTGSYKTDGWVTVSIPLTEFKYDKGETVDNRKLTTFANMRTFFMGFFGALPEGIDSNEVKLCIDNLRIVPKE